MGVARHRGVMPGHWGCSASTIWGGCSTEQPRVYGSSPTDECADATPAQQTGVRTGAGRDRTARPKAGDRAAPGVLGRRCWGPAALPPHQALAWPQRVAVGTRDRAPINAGFAHLFERVVASALPRSEGSGVSAQQVPRSNIGAQSVVRVGGALCPGSIGPHLVRPPRSDRG